MLAGPDVDAVLSAHGIRPGPRGYGCEQLEAAAAARGWIASATEIPQATRWTRWQAVVRRPVPEGWREPVARGRGASREAALAAALATALNRRTGGG